MRRSCFGSLRCFSNACARGVTWVLICLGCLLDALDTQAGYLYWAGVRVSRRATLTALLARFPKVFVTSCSPALSRS